MELNRAIAINKYTFPYSTFIKKATSMFNYLFKVLCTGSLFVEKNVFSIIEYTFTHFDHCLSIWKQRKTNVRSIFYKCKRNCIGAQFLCFIKIRLVNEFFSIVFGYDAVKVVWYFIFSQKMQIVHYSTIYQRRNATHFAIWFFKYRIDTASNKLNILF